MEEKVDASATPGLEVWRMDPNRVLGLVRHHYGVFSVFLLVSLKRVCNWPVWDWPEESGSPIFDIP